jgi:hypothetical protein
MFIATFIGVFGTDGTQAVQHHAQKLPASTTAGKERLYDSAPEYWVITNKPQQISATWSNKLQQNRNPAGADERGSCRA